MWRARLLPAQQKPQISIDVVQFPCYIGECDTESGDSANSTVSEHAWNVHQDIESPEAQPDT